MQPSPVHFIVLAGRFAPPLALRRSLRTSPSPLVVSRFGENRMPAWKVLFILALALVCLGLAFATFIVPMTLTAGTERWLWLAGLLAGTAGMSALFARFVRRASGFM